MSKLGFDKIIAKLPEFEKQFLTRGMKLAQQEFKGNFDSESNAESGTRWPSVVRKVPPPILVKTGELKSQATKTGRLVFRKGSVTLYVDPIDRDGRAYASYHQDGVGVKQRSFITQSDSLTSKQTNLLISLADKMFT